MSQDLMQQLIDHALAGNGDIATAAWYLRDMEKCVKSNNASWAKAIGVEDADSWEPILKAARGKLVYADPTGLGIKALSDSELEKSYHVDGAIMYSEGIISTADEDRDGDIVETKGLVFVEKMPILFQHMHPSPVGVMVAVTDQTEKSATSLMAFLDTSLSRDMSKFVKAGAMRYSIGFLPKQMTINGTYVNSQGDEVPTGFRIKSAEVYETSAVTVPANANTRTLRVYEKEFDAVCKTFSNEKLEDDAVRAWAKSLFEIRPKVFKGAEFEKTVEPQTEPAAEVQPADAHVEVKPSPITKDVKDQGHQKMYIDGGEDALKGSYEDRQRQLYKKVRKFLQLHDACDGYPHLVSTFDDHCIVSCWDWEDDELYSYRIDYSMSEGKVALNGEPKQIKVEVSVVEKAVGTAKMKAWREKESRTVKSEKAVAEAPQTTPVAESKDPILAFFGL